MNKIKIALVLLTSFSVIAGCSSSNAGLNEQEKPLVEVSSTTNSESSIVTVEKDDTKEVEEPTIPEPLRMASEQLSSGNIDLAKTYLDLTITDFKDTDASFVATVLKSTLLVAESRSYSRVRNSLNKGVDNMSAILVEDNEIERLNTTLTEDFDKELKLIKDFEESAQYILSNYKNHTDFKLTDLALDVKIRSAKTDLSFFERVGYPVPTKTQMDDTRKYTYEFLIKEYFGEVFINEELNYANYFYIAGANLAKIPESKLIEPVMKEVISLTEEDKYNKYRIEVQEYLKKMK